MHVLEGHMSQEYMQLDDVREFYILIDIDVHLAMTRQCHTIRNLHKMLTQPLWHVDTALGIIEISFLPPATLLALAVNILYIESPKPNRMPHTAATTHQTIALLYALKGVSNCP
jgi:hypothetical protein